MDSNNEEGGFSEEQYSKELDNESFDDGGFYGGGYGMQSSLPSEQNLIEWQLDFKKDLEEIRNYLSGYKKEYDEKGNERYVAPEKDEEVPFNDFGVNVIMGHIRAYLNRNTVLSNYDSKRIKKILFDLGMQLGNEIENTYEELGMDTPYKQRRFKLIVINILHMVESAYNRSLRGGERESLRTARTVNQSDPMGSGQRGSFGGGIPQRSKKWYQPKTWI